MEWSFRISKPVNQVIDRAVTVGVVLVLALAARPALAQAPGVQVLDDQFDTLISRFAGLVGLGQIGLYVFGALVAVLVLAGGYFILESQWRNVVWVGGGLLVVALAPAIVDFLAGDRSVGLGTAGAPVISDVAIRQPEGVRQSSTGIEGTTLDPADGYIPPPFGD